MKLRTIVTYLAAFYAVLVLLFAQFLGLRMLFKIHFFAIATLCYLTGFTICMFGIVLPPVMLGWWIGEELGYFPQTRPLNFGQ